MRKEKNIALEKSRCGMKIWDYLGLVLAVSPNSYSEAVISLDPGVLCPTLTTHVQKCQGTLWCDLALLGSV